MLGVLCDLLILLPEFGEILHHPVSDAFIRLSGWNVSGVREKISRHMLSEMMAKYVVISSVDNAIRYCSLI
jgi:hypothetical protein